MTDNIWLFVTSNLDPFQYLAPESSSGTTDHNHSCLFHHLSQKDLVFFQYLERISFLTHLFEHPAVLGSVPIMIMIILTHFFEHPAVLGSILPKLKGLICHVRVPPPKSLRNLGEVNDQLIYYREHDQQHQVITFCQSPI